MRKEQQFRSKEWIDCVPWVVKAHTRRSSHPGTWLLIAILGGLLSSCSSPQISSTAVTRSDSGSLKLLAEARRAHGETAFKKAREITVHYDGQWGPVGPRFQPVLADRKFRQDSVETLSLATKTLLQKHTGSAGSKEVLRSPGKVVVTYNGQPSQDEEARRAAALVADAYTLFLLGPFYFDRPGVVILPAPEGSVDGIPCDQVLAVLRPGFGFSPEDRIILSIDKSSKLLRRVRMTLNGLASTQGAEVDVTFREFKEIDGIIWPTDFDERIRVPFDLHAHHWKLTKLDVRPQQ